MKSVDASKLLQYYVVVDGAPFAEDAAVIAALFQPAFDEGSAASQVFWYERGRWWVGPMLGFEAVSLAFDERSGAALVLGREGHWASARAEDILRQGGARRSPGPFRQVRRVGAGGHYLAVGEARTVFVLAGGALLPLNDDVPMQLPAASEEDLVEQLIADSDLLFDVSGNGPEDLVAVGSGGRIVTIRDRKLKDLPSPTNAPLYCIWRRTEGDYVVGGHQGLLLFGAGDAWDEYAVVEGAGDIASVIEFRDRLLACDGQAIYVEQPGRQFSVANLGVGSTVPAHALRRSPDALLTIAGKEVFRTSDGVTWSNLL